MVKLNKLFVACGICFIANVTTVNASDNVSDFEKAKANMLSSFSDQQTKTEQEFSNAKLAYIDAFNRAKEELAKQWDVPQLSNKTQWVQYTKNDTVRRAVDFEKGTIVVEILDNKPTQEKIDQIVSQQIKELETQTTQQAIVKDKVLGKNKTKANSNFAEIKVMPKLEASTLLSDKKIESYTQNNGKKVTKVSMGVPQNTVEKRAESYIPYVNKVAEKWGIEPELILAIMHTESHFNPVAQSHIPAYGLMQVVPTSAGKDVTKRYMGGEKLLPPEVLFNPEFNIDIGTSYLNILDKHYLKNVKDKEVRTYLTISSYNGGIGAVAKHFSGKASLSTLPPAVATLEPQAVYQSLAEDFPYKETRNYIKKVQDKREFYQELLSR